jgi:hypothetical protein
MIGLVASVQHSILTLYKFFIHKLQLLVPFEYIGLVRCWFVRSLGCLRLTCLEWFGLLDPLV